ncbi:L-threonylcarbamoyladenylate synthase [Desulfosarcina cetonica]|uniref:L-threonylcarbamoyladenylate synthase n=1 Tax=Desulfosarcina cetonica TaxID=90730 RepID=UPI0006D22B21|nr:L-threonylcarbamoyladenylate synthase [Desulfosarcina cetonica]
MITFPTSGLYGLGADALSERAVHRVFAIKRRPADKPMLVLLSSTGEMDRVVRRVPDYARPLLTLWPGGLTLIFEAAEVVPPVLTGGTGKIGVRLPRHPVAKALTVGFGGPITGTSANISGQAAAASAAEIAPEISRQVDLTLDAGGLSGGPGSTVVDLTVWPIRIVREGAVPMATIYHLLRQT